MKNHFFVFIFSHILETNDDLFLEGVTILFGPEDKCLEIFYLDREENMGGQGDRLVLEETTEETDEKGRHRSPLSTHWKRAWRIGQWAWTQGKAT